MFRKKACNSSPLLKTLLYIFFTASPFFLIAQSQEIDTLSALEQLGGDGYREGQYPGLGKAASEIFYSKKRITFSGYAEFNNVFNGGNKRDISSGDLELYFNTLYRVSPFIGVRISKNWFWITELGVEHIEGNGESHTNFFPESYMDIIFRSWLSVRFGILPLNIGYINNNEEPLLFFSVNRPETERIILPSEWIEMGISFYGDVFNKVNYSLGFTNGILARDFQSPTWIRQGAQGQLESFNKIAINAQINYLPAPNLTMSLSSYFNLSGRDDDIELNGISNTVSAPVRVISGYARWDKSGFRIIGMGVFGNLGETRELYLLTEKEQGTAQVLGQEAFGFYIEPSFDIFSLFSSISTKVISGKIFTLNHPELPFFVRYERLDTHSKIDASLANFDLIRTNLGVWTYGFNFRPNQKIALKFDVQNRNKLTPVVGIPNQEWLFELGLGIEF
jgi:hypothetical protein